MSLNYSQALCSISPFNKGVLEQHCQDATAPHARMGECVMIFGLNMFVSAKVPLEEETVIQVNKYISKYREVD